MPVTTEVLLSFTAHDSGLADIGHGDHGFAYNCEGPRHKTWPESFAIADRPVTNRDWIGFMEEGGYDTATLWLSDGWTCCQNHDWDAPLYWWRRDDNRWTFTLRGA